MLTENSQRGKVCASTRVESPVRNIPAPGLGTVINDRTPTVLVAGMDCDRAATGALCYSLRSNIGAAPTKAFQFKLLMQDSSRSFDIRVTASE